MKHKYQGLAYKNHSIKIILIKKNSTETLYGIYEFEHNGDIYKGISHKGILDEACFAVDRLERRDAKITNEMSKIFRD